VADRIDGKLPDGPVVGASDSAVETHIVRAREAGATEEEIKHVLLLIIQTTGFPGVQGSLFNIQEIEVVHVLQEGRLFVPPA
jgi:hypothetical protein